MPDDLDAIGHGFFRFLGGRRFTSGLAAALRRMCCEYFKFWRNSEFVVAILQKSDGVAEKPDHFKSEFDQFGLGRFRHCHSPAIRWAISFPSQPSARRRWR